MPRRLDRRLPAARSNAGQGSAEWISDAVTVVTQYHTEHPERHLLAYAYGHLGEHDLLQVRTDSEKSLLLAVLNLVECIAAVNAKPAKA